MKKEDKENQSARMSREIGLREERMIRSRRRKVRSVWTGFGFFGLVGWSVVLPALIGTALGRWLDKSHPEGRSWTLVFLVAGLSLGCLNAWRWILREHREIENPEEDDPDE